ncbi:MAG: hypothetical protein OHK0056_12410 [Bacteriovoracaceae bacterium]
MKKLIQIILLAALSFTTYAQVVTTSVDTILPTLLKADQTKMSLVELQKLAEDRNQDLEIAFENYIIAKRRVTVARSDFNPFGTGHVLGLALGLNYLWVPLAVEAVLSIPTKIYNISKNSSLAKAEAANYARAQKKLKNEIAHLYFDIVTHETILKTIDIELGVYAELQKHYESLQNAARVNEVVKTVLALQIERINIGNLLIEELAALRTMVLKDINDKKIELSQISSELNDLFIQNTDLNTLESVALRNSDEYRMFEHLYDASIKNVKQVKWSILTFSGMNFAYGKRIKIAKNEREIARLEREASELKVKKTAVAKLDTFQSALDVFANYNSLSDSSVDFYRGVNINYSNNAAPFDAVAQSAIGAIRDFRNKVVAHYAAWSAFDDLKLAAGVEFKFDSTGERTIQTQMEK